MVTPDSLGDPTDGPDYSNHPGAGVFLAPARVVERMIPWTRTRLSEAFFVRISASLGWTGAQAVFVAGTAGVIYLLVAAIRSDSLSLAVIGLLVPVAAAVLQFAALRFATQGEGRVRSTPTRIGNFAIFELLGIVLALLGASVIVWSFVEMIRDFDREALAGLVIQCGLGYLVLIVGALFLNPVLINVHEHAGCTLGQDGLAIVGAMFKAILAGARVAFGSAAAVGGLAAVAGCLWSIVDQEDLRPHLMFSFGAFAVIAAALLPLYGYVASAVYFVLVDVLDSLIGLRRGQ